MKLKINIENINPKYRVKKSNIHKIIKLVFSEEKKPAAEIGIIFVDDDYIIELNKKFLDKDDTTDVLSFPLGDSDVTAVVGEIYINLNQVEEQAADYNVSFDEEMNRMVIHGLLHLLGYRDQTVNEKNEMTIRENYFLQLLKK